MAFDPDEYLNETGSPSTATTEFDPDAYLSELDSEEKTEFDPDAYLKEQPTVAGLRIPEAPPVVERPVEKEEEGILRKAADVPVRFLGGTAGVLKSVADVFGADSPASKDFAERQRFFQNLVSESGKEKDKRAAEIMKSTEDASLWERAKSAGKAFLESPSSMLSTGAGSLAPFIATAGAGTALRLGAAGIRGLQVATGAVSGAGAVKGEIYDAVKQAALDAGKSEEDAEALAAEAQSYGENPEQILAGGALGALAAATGIEATAGRAIAGAARQAATGAQIVGKNVAQEVTTEIPQEAQTALAKNFALQKAGFDVPTLQGVVEAGTTAGIVAAALGGVAGGIDAVAAASENAQKVKLAVNTQSAAQEVSDIAPLTASVVSDQAEAVGREGARDLQTEADQKIAEITQETPEQRVARLQEEATAAAGIELEEEGVGVEPTVPVTPPVAPTPEGAVAPVEPVVEPVVAEPQPVAETLPKNWRELTIQDRASWLSGQVAGTVVGSAAREGKANDIDIRVEETQAQDAATRLQQLGYEAAGSSLVSPEDARKAGKDFGGNWARAQRFLRYEDGRLVEQIDIWNQDTTPEVTPPAEVGPTPEAVTPTPNLEPLRRVARAEQTEEDVSGLVGQGLVELYNGQPVITQAGLEALPEAERPRLNPEARKIQIDTGANEVVAEAIAKNLRIGVDQVGPNVTLPAGWTLVEDIYVPPTPTVAAPTPTPEEQEVQRVMAQFGTATDYTAKRIIDGLNFDTSEVETIPENYTREIIGEREIAVGPVFRREREQQRKLLKELNSVERAAISGRLVDEGIISKEDAQRYIDEAIAFGVGSDLQKISDAEERANEKWDERKAAYIASGTVAGEVEIPPVDHTAEEAERAKQPKVNPQKALDPEEISGLTVREVLLKMASMNFGASEFEAAGRPLTRDMTMQRLASVLSKLPLRGLDAERVLTEGFRGTALAYRSSAGDIFIPKTDGKKKAYVSPDTLIHEIGHTLTLDAFNKYVKIFGNVSGDKYYKALEKSLADKRTPRPVKKIIALYIETIDQLGLREMYFGKGGLADNEGPKSLKRARERSDKNKPTNPLTGRILPDSQLYGLANIDEFVSEIFSEPAFQDLVKTISVDGGQRSAWKKFVEAIRELLGLPSKSITEQVISAAVKTAALETETGGGRTIENRLFEVREAKNKKIQQGIADQEKARIKLSWKKSTSDWGSELYNATYKFPKANQIADTISVEIEKDATGYGGYMLSIEGRKDGKFVDMTPFTKATYGISSLKKAKDRILDVIYEVSLASGAPAPEVRESRREPTPLTQQDREYLDAVERGDLDAVSKAVEQAAKEAGYTVGPIVHGTKEGNKFTIFRQSKNFERVNIGFHFGTREQAENRVRGDAEGEGGEFLNVYLKGNFVRIPDLGGFEPNSVATWMEKTKGWITPEATERVDALLEKAQTAQDITNIFETIIYPEFYKRGYNGIVYKNQIEGTGDSYAVFSPEQIKLSEPVTRDNQGNIIPPSQRFQPTEEDIRYKRIEMPRPAGMETEAVATKLESLGFGRGGIVSVVNEPDASFEGRTIIRDGKVVGIELNAAALKDDAAIERVLNHEIAESANADGALNNLVAGLTPKERKEINDAITRLGYAEKARTAEEAARAVELLAEGWRGRKWFDRAVARVEAWANKLGYKLTRRAAEYIAARNMAEVNESFRKMSTADALANLRGARKVNFNGLRAVLIPPSEMEFAYSIAAYHGTPHEIKGRFQLAKIGTGEGATVYGWGLYFAENIDVALEYKNRLAKELRYAGSEFDNKNPSHVAADKLAMGKFYGKSREEVIQELENDVDYYADNENTQAQQWSQQIVQILRDNNEAKIERVGNLYSVDLDVSEDQLMDWDKPLSEQNPEVRKKLEPLLPPALQKPFEKKTIQELVDEDPTIQYVYRYRVMEEMNKTSFLDMFRALPQDEREFRAKQKVSEAFSSAGIIGIRYLDQGSRFAQPKKTGFGWLVDDYRGSNYFKTKEEATKFAEEAQTRNYVIFDEDVISITGRNGQPVDIRESRREDAIPTFSEGSPEASTLSNMKESMAKVDAASEAKGGKPETYKISEIASVWMDQGGDTRQLQDMVVEYTNLTPANAKKVANAIAKQYGLQQQIAETGAVIAEPAPEAEGAPRKTSVQRLIEQAVGVRRPIVKLEVNEKTALKDQIRLKAREARETRKARKEAARELAEAVTQYVKDNQIRGPVRARQTISLAKQALKLDVNNEKAVDRYIMYVERVVENANYDKDLSDAKALRKRAKEMAKKKNIGPEQKKVLEAIGNINPSLLDNPYEYNVLTERYLLGFLPVTSRRYSVMPDAEARQYLESLEEQMKRNQAELDRAELERFFEAQAGFAEQRGLSLDEAQNLLNEDGDIATIIQDYNLEKRKAAEEMLLNLAQNAQETLKTYDDSANTARQKELISFMQKVKLESITSDEKKRFIRFANNILANGETFGVEQFEAVAKAQERLVEAAKDKRLAQKMNAWIGPLSGGSPAELVQKLSLITQSEVDTLKNIFGREAVGVFRRVLGLLDLDVAQTASTTAKEKVANKVGDFYKKLKKKYGEESVGRESNIFTTAAAYFIQAEGNKTQEESIAYRRRLWTENIEELRKSERREDREEAEIKQRALDSITGNSNAEILDSLRSINPAAYEQLMWWKDQMHPEYKPFLKDHVENFRNQANNYDNVDYLSIHYKWDQSPELPSDLEIQEFDDPVSFRIKQAANSVKRKDHPSLPVNPKTRVKANIDVNFGYNQYNALTEQIEKAYTAPAWEAVSAFVRDPLFEQVVGGKTNADFVKNILRNIKATRTRKAMLDDENQIIGGTVALTRRISTQATLGGFTQPLRQVPDQLFKLFATTGRWDLISRNIVDSLLNYSSVRNNPLLNKLPIGRRGDARAGSQFAAEFNELARKVEASVTNKQWTRYKELMTQMGEFWMTPLRGSDTWIAKVSWMSYYEAELNKRDIKMESWEREAELFEIDPARQEAAAQAEYLVDFYAGASDPTKMAALSKQGNNGWREFSKLIFLSLNSFALQQKSALMSDFRDLILRSGSRQAALAGITGAIGGMVAFHGMRIFIIGGLLYPAAMMVLKGIFGIDMDEPDEEEQEKQLKDNWRKMKASIYSNIVAGGAGQFLEGKSIDAFNRTMYLWDAHINPDEMMDDKGEFISFSKYEKEKSPFYRFRSYDKSEFTFGLADVLTEQAQRSVDQTAQLLSDEEMSVYTGNEQAYALFATGVEWAYFFRLMDTDLKRITTKLKNDIDKQAKEREAELRAIRNR